MPCSSDPENIRRSVAAPMTLRIGDRERAEAGERLAAHAAAGRLSVEELEERLERANAAVSTADLVALEADLPDLRPSASARRLPRSAPTAVAGVLAAAVAAVVLGVVLVGHPVAPLFLVPALLATTRRVAWRRRPVGRPYP
jgi:hypothetical protein